MFQIDLFNMDSVATATTNVESFNLFDVCEDDDILPLEKVLRRGTLTAGGKERIVHIFNTVSDENERVRLVKNEYGIGGMYSGFEHYLKHGYSGFDTMHNALTIYGVDSSDKQGVFRWDTVTQMIHILIMKGKYL